MEFYFSRIGVCFSLFHSVSLTRILYYYDGTAYNRIVDSTARVLQCNTSSISGYLLTGFVFFFFSVFTSFFPCTRAYQCVVSILEDIRFKCIKYLCSPFLFSLRLFFFCSFFHAYRTHAHTRSHSPYAIYGCKHEIPRPSHMNVECSNCWLPGKICHLQFHFY